MTTGSSPRSRGAALAGALLVGLAGLAWWAPGTAAAPAPTSTSTSSTTADPTLVERGRHLFVEGCSSCHGIDGRGTGQGPDLTDVGAAAADFQLTTGRMPLAAPGAATVRKPPAYEPDEIAELVAFVASLGNGPPIPVVDVESGDLVEGGELYRANSAACHNAAGSGGALSYGHNAPSLLEATPVQVVEAMRTGPGQMPVFGASALTDAEVDAVARYVTGELQHPRNRGGLPLGATGPVPEGFVAWIVGLVVIGGALRWIVGREGG